MNSTNEKDTCKNVMEVEEEDPRPICPCDECRGNDETINPEIDEDTTSQKKNSSPSHENIPQNVPQNVPHENKTSNVESDLAVNEVTQPTNNNKDGLSKADKSRKDTQKKESDVKVFGVSIDDPNFDYRTLFILPCQLKEPLPVCPLKPPTSSIDMALDTSRAPTAYLRSIVETERSREDAAKLLILEPLFETVGETIENEEERGPSAVATNSIPQQPESRHTSEPVADQINNKSNEVLNAPSVQPSHEDNSKNIGAPQETCRPRITITLKRKKNGQYCVMTPGKKRKCTKKNKPDDRMILPGPSGVECSAEKRSCMTEIEPDETMILPGPSGVGCSAEERSPSPSIPSDVDHSSDVSWVPSEEDDTSDSEYKPTSLGFSMTKKRKTSTKRTKDAPNKAAPGTCHQARHRSTSRRDATMNDIMIRSVSSHVPEDNAGVSNTWVIPGLFSIRCTLGSNGFCINKLLRKFQRLPPHLQCFHVKGRKGFTDVPH